jgi:thiol-disulfide isomerase/thioredoxin
MTSYPRTGAESHPRVMIAPPWRYHVRVYSETTGRFDAFVTSPHGRRPRTLDESRPPASTKAIHPPSESNESNTDAVAPRRSLRDRLSDMRGRLALLVLWTPWCPPAIRELRHIEHAYRALSAEGLDVVGLAESGELDQIRSVASAHGLSWPTSTPDSVRELIKDRLHIFSNPSYIVVDADRRIVMVSRTRESDLQLRGTKLAETLQRLLRQPR